MVTVVDANQLITIQVHPAQKSFTVPLAANPTTGYQWSVLDFDKKVLTLSASVYQRPNTQLIGAGGTMLFTFTLNQGAIYPKRMNLTFQYARPWEKNKTGTVQKVRVVFQ